MVLKGVDSLIRLKEKKKYTQCYIYNMYVLVKLSDTPGEYES